MTQKTNFLNICATMPNIGSFIFYLIFVFLMPIFLLVIKKELLILTYLPLIVPLAVIMQESGNDKVFQNLYPSSNENKVGMTSKILINIIAILAILYHVSELTTINKTYGVSMGFLSLALIFLYAPLLIPLVIKKADIYVKKKGYSTKYNWHKYITGFLMLVSIILIDTVLNLLFLKFII